MTGDDVELAVFEEPPPDPELQRLEPLVGTWRTEDHTLDGVYGPGVPVRSEESFSWPDGGDYLVQTYETVFGDEPHSGGRRLLVLRLRPQPAPHHLPQQHRALLLGGERVRGLGGGREAHEGLRGAFPVLPGRGGHGEDHSRRHERSHVVAPG